MANRFPLIANSSSNQIQELANADNLDLTGNNIVGLKNIIATGVATAAQFSGNITGVAATFSGNVSVGGVLTYEDVTNIDSVGVVTARVGIRVLAGGINAVGVVTATTFSGSGANLTNIPSAQLSGALPAISGASLTGLPPSGVGIKTAGGNVGFGPKGNMFPKDAEDRKRLMNKYGGTGSAAAKAAAQGKQGNMKGVGRA